MNNDETNSQLYAELYKRGRALLKRGNTETFSLGDFIVEGIEGGGLWIFYDDRGPTRGPRLLMQTDKNGVVQPRGPIDVDALNEVLTTLSNHMVLDDLSEI